MSAIELAIVVERLVRLVHGSRQRMCSLSNVVVVLLAATAAPCMPIARQLPTLVWLVKCRQFGQCALGQTRFTCYTRAQPVKQPLRATVGQNKRLVVRAAGPTPPSSFATNTTNLEAGFVSPGKLTCSISTIRFDASQCTIDCAPLGIMRVEGSYFEAIVHRNESF